MTVDRDKLQAWVEQYVAGTPVLQIARSARVRQPTVSAALREAGVLTGRGRPGGHPAGRRPDLVKPSRWNHGLPETTVAYIAGLFDGEGSISYSPAMGGHWRSSLTQLSSTGLVPWLIETTGAGTAHTHRTRTKPIDQWVLSRPRELVDFLTATLPYLRVKKTRAAEALAGIGQPIRTAEENH